MNQTNLKNTSTHRRPMKPFLINKGPSQQGIFGCLSMLSQGEQPLKGNHLPSLLKIIQEMDFNGQENARNQSEFRKNPRPPVPITYSTRTRDISDALCGDLSHLWPNAKKEGEISTQIAGILFVSAKFLNKQKNIRVMSRPKRICPASQPFSLASSSSQRNRCTLGRSQSQNKP